MNRNIYNYLYAVLLLSLALLPTGCADDGDGLCPEPDSGTTSYVTFRVVTPKAMATRGVPENGNNADHWEDYLSEQGVAFDNAIIGNRFNVFITQEDGTQITKLQNLIYMETTSADDKVVYSFSGEIPKDKVEGLKAYSNAKIHIAANCDASESLTDDLTFAHAGQPSATFAAIPMWGVGTFDFTELKPGQNDAGEIWLLRAMAKVEIVIDKSNSNNLITALTSASVKTNTSGYVLPQDWKNVTDTKTLTFANTLHALSPTATIDNMTPPDDQTVDKIVFYLPETENTGGETVITLNYATDLQGNEKRRNQIKFAKYEGGTATQANYDVVRNHLYRFKVSYGGNTDAFEIKYTVCPWQTYTIEPPTFN